MDKSRHTKRGITHDNLGFTLIELIISIVILVLVMLPLMNSFYRSAQMNKKAEDIQVQSNLAASIMEGLKSLNVEETVEQFRGPIGDFDVISDADGNPMEEDIMILTFNSITGVYEEVVLSADDTLGEQATYYFAIHGIKVGSTAYDALITMNSAAYQASSDILNNYEMPDAINLDVMANGLLFSDGQSAEDTMDSEALTTFLQLGNDYAYQQFLQSNTYQDYQAAYDLWENDCEISAMQALPTPTPPAEVIFNPSAVEYQNYSDETTLKSEITKTMTITVNQALSNRLEYNITYTCGWPAANGLTNTLEYKVSAKTYSKVLENIYLFYEPSLFKNTTVTHYDVVEIDNQTPGHPINFYLAKQEGSFLLPDAKITQSDPDSISVFTNLESINVNSITAVNQGIVKTERKDRIYDVDIQLFHYVNSDNPADKYKKLLYTLSSSNEN